MGKNLSYLTLLLIANIVSFAVSAQDLPRFNVNVKNITSGAPLSNAPVFLKGLKHDYQTTTDVNGDFTFHTSVKIPFTVVLSSPGYKTREVIVHAHGLYDTTKVKLKPINIPRNLK